MTTTAAPRLHVALVVLTVAALDACGDSGETFVDDESSTSSGADTTATTTITTTSADVESSEGAESADDTTSTTGTADTTGTTDTTEGTAEGPSETTTDDGGACDFAEDCPASTDPCRQAACVNSVCDTLPFNEGGLCDDGLFCTAVDSCVAGQCLGGKTPCGADACSEGVCDEGLQACVPTPVNEGGSCDDGDACTYDGTCVAGSCNPGTPLDCSFLNSECGTGSCEPGVGCVLNAMNEGGVCNDGQFCTASESCQNGLCVGTQPSCGAPADPCLVSGCDENSDTCFAVPGNDGAACDDASGCTTSETCSNGTCGSGMPANEGAACDDGDACTSGTTCAGGACGSPTGEIDMCTPDDACCPEGCSEDVDGDCLYWQSGVQQNVPASALVGWSMCWNGTYDQSSPPLPTVLTDCDAANLLLACRPLGATSWSLLAMAPRADVLFDCGQQVNCTQQANGVGWYYSNAWSWGFAPAGEPVNRNSCDYNEGNQTAPERRMCWHTQDDAITGGYRCGANDLNGSFGWERAVFEAD